MDFCPFVLAQLAFPSMGHPQKQSGTATFEQYLDNWGGSSTGSNHQVTTGNHFNHWNSIGMKLGTFNYMILGTESYGGRSGYVNATVW